MVVSGIGVGRFEVRLVGVRFLSFPSTARPIGVVEEFVGIGVGWTFGDRGVDRSWLGHASELLAGVTGVVGRGLRHPEL